MSLSGGARQQTEFAVLLRYSNLGGVIMFRVLSQLLYSIGRFFSWLGRLFKAAALLIRGY